MPSKKRPPVEDFVPFGVPETDPIAPSVRRKMGQGAKRGRPQRSRAALRPLWYSLPLLVIALLAAAYLLGLTVWSRSSQSQWNSGNYQAAQAGHQGQMTWTSHTFERWVAHYNLGTDLLSLGNIDEGIAQLREAYDGVPKAVETEPGRIQTFSYECTVRINLSLGIEMKGDGQMAAHSYEEAAATYREAEDTVSPCQSSGSGQSGQSGGQGGGGQSQNGDAGDQGEQADESTSRVSEKRQDAENQADGGGDSQEGEQGSQGQQDQSDQSQGGQDQSDQSQGNGQDQNGQGQGSSQGQEGEASNPYAGETPDQQRRREALEQQNQDNRRSQEAERDGRRTGNPNGAW